MLKMAHLRKHQNLRKKSKTSKFAKSAVSDHGADPKKLGNVNMEEEDGVVFTIATQFSDGLCDVMEELEEQQIVIRQEEEQYDVENAVIVDGSGSMMQSA